MNPEFKQIIIPSPVQLLGYGFASVLLLVATNYTLLIERFLRQTLITPQAFHVVLEQYFLQISQTQAVYYLVIGLFWSAAGLLLYSALWALGNLGVEARNFMIYEHEYTHRNSFRNRWWGRAKEVSLRLLLAATVIGAVIATILYGLPLWLGLFAQGIFSFSAAATAALGYAAAAVAGLGLNLYLLRTLIRVFILAN